MRLFLGIILGVALTIGGAYISDTMSAGSTVNGAATADYRPMVNWDVVTSNWHDLRANVRAGWNKLSAG